ncbi:hypothetical protein F4604DRAFT_1577157 [Suillus subluteus]|nr:hypothetical protein F4604DRAFT_1577157 [Suillus subluteus]
MQDCCIPVPPAFLPSTSEVGKDHIFGWHHPSSGYIFGKVPNVLEAMENDQFAYQQHHTPFYPFQDQAEFELGKFLCECFTQSDIDRFLKLEWVRQAKPLFGSKDQLLAWMASLPTGPKWRSTTLEITGYPTVQPIQLIWRNGLDVVADLFANPIFANHMTYDPHVVVDGDEHEYSEYFTAQQAFEIQDQLPKGATIILIIIASDKTPMTVKTVLKGYQIRRALASARALCPFPEYCPLFQSTKISCLEGRISIVTDPVRLPDIRCIG